MACNSSSSSMNLKRLEGKVAIITGGASGIGECTARIFAKHGAKVIIADVQDDLGRSICEGSGSQPDEEIITYVHCDVSEESDVQNVVQTAISMYGKLDIMLSNAGIPGSDISILDAEAENIRRVIDVNLVGSIFCAKHAARVMIPEKKGVILFTSSAVSVSSTSSFHTYTATKHALVGLAKNLCVELGDHGIRVNCVSPFVVLTQRMRNEVFPGYEREKAEECVSKGANLKNVTLREDDIAKAALYLASDDAKYVSGLNLVVDGGFSTTNAALLNMIA